MKSIFNTVVAGVAGIFLLTGCRKDDSVVVTPNGTVNAPIKKGVQQLSAGSAAATDASDPVVTYMISTSSPSTNALILWYGGYITVGTIFFDGNYLNGNEIRKEHYSSSVNRQVNLFAPDNSGSAPVTLGSLNMTGGTYYLPIFGIDMVSDVAAPARTVNGQSVANDALFLTGAYNVNGAVVTVQFAVQQSILLTAAGSNPLDMFGSQGNYTSVFTMQLDELVAGLTPQMLGAAVITNGKLTISSALNTNLYQLLLGNLQVVLRLSSIEWQPGNVGRFLKWPPRVDGCNELAAILLTGSRIMFPGVIDKSGAFLRILLDKNDAIYSS